MIIIVINAIFVLFVCLRIFSPRLMDRVDSLFPSLFPPTSSSFFSFRLRSPRSSTTSTFSSTSCFPSYGEENATTRKPRAFRYARVRSVGCACVGVISMRPYARRTQCTRNEVVSPLVISETFLPARKQPQERTPFTRR